MNPKLKEKLLESLMAVLPITLIVLALSVALVPMDVGTAVMFTVGAVLLVFGMGLFQLGAEMAMTPLGEGIGVQMERVKKIPLIVAIAFVMGVIITIAREHGSSGKQIGKLVAQKLGIPFYYKEMVALAAHESELDREFISDIHKNAPDAMRDLYLSSQVVQRAIAAQDRIIRRIADNGLCVIVGRAADYVLREHKNVVRVFVHAPLDYRIRRVMEVYGDTLREANAISATSTRRGRRITGTSPAAAGAMPKTMN